MSRPSALPRTPPGRTGGNLHYPRLEILQEEGDDDDEYHPRLEDEEDVDDDDDTEDVITVLPTTNSRPSTGFKLSTSSKTSTGHRRPVGSKQSTTTPASLEDIKLLMKEMEERHDKFLDKALDELQGTVAETFSKLSDRLSSLEDHAKNQQTSHPRDRLLEIPTQPCLQTQNLPGQNQRDRYFGSALAAHAEARNPRPNVVPPLGSATTRSTTAPLSSSTPLSSTSAAAHLRGGAAGGDGDRRGDDPVREAALKVEDVGAFVGKDVEHYVRTLEIISDIYGERRLLLVLLRCMKGIAKEWFISIPEENRHFTRSVEG